PLVTQNPPARGTDPRRTPRHPRRHPLPPAHRLPVAATPSPLGDRRGPVSPLARQRRLGESPPRLARASPQAGGPLAPTDGRHSGQPIGQDVPYRFRYLIITRSKSKNVCASALVHRPTLPARLIVPSFASRCRVPSRKHSICSPTMRTISVCHSPGLTSRFSL